jgi:hypothetical protein
MDEHIEQQKAFENKTKKNFWLFLGVIMLTALTVGGSMYFLLNRQSQIKTNEFKIVIQNLNSQLLKNEKEKIELNKQILKLQSQIEDLSNASRISENEIDIKQYNNDEYKISFYYPKDYIIKKVTGPDISGTKLFLSFNSQEYEDEIIFYFSIINLDDYSSLDNYILVNFPNTQKVTTKDINGKTFSYVTGHSDYISSDFVSYIIQNKGNTYQFSTSSGYRGIEEYDMILEKVLESLEFN